MNRFFILLSCFFISTHAINSFSSYPYNSSECYQCIENINYIHKNNISLKELYDNLDDFCTYFNISCSKMDAKEYNFLMSNSTQVCESLNKCDTLSLTNYITSGTELSLPLNLHIFYYYNTIIAYSLNISDNGDTQFTTEWNIKLDEPYNDAIFIQMTGGSEFINGTHIYNCNECNYPNVINILKINTPNYIYYLNATNGILLDRIHVINNYIPRLRQITITYNYNKSTPINDNIVNMYDPIYNGSLYVVDFNIKTFFSSRSCFGNVHPCYYTTLGKISLEPRKFILPSIPLTCYQSLRKYCPNTNITREKCLNCLISHKDVLNVCSVTHEESWCELIY